MAWAFLKWLFLGKVAADFKSIRCCFSFRTTFKYFLRSHADTMRLNCVVSRYSIWVNFSMLPVGQKNLRDLFSSYTVKGADNMWSQNSMRTCTVAILVTPNWNSASVETGGTNQYRAHCIHLSLAVPIRRKFRFLFKNSWCRRSQTIFSWCRRNEWETTFASVYFSWSWRS